MITGNNLTVQDDGDPFRVRARLLNDTSDGHPLRMFALNAIDDELHSLQDTFRVALRQDSLPSPA